MLIAVTSSLAGEYEEQLRNEHAPAPIHGHPLMCMACACHAHRYEEQLRNERMAASAQLVQKHRRMTVESDQRMRIQRAESEVASAAKIEDYAAQAQRKVEEAAARADRAEAEFAWASRELGRVQVRSPAFSRLLPPSLTFSHLARARAHAGRL